MDEMSKRHDIVAALVPSPGFKLVVLIGFLDDSWVFLNVFLNGHNIKRIHLCSKIKIMKIKMHK
jgi:hypothetical protein